MAGIEAQTSTEDLSVLTNREEIQEAVALFKARLTQQAAELGRLPTPNLGGQGPDT